MDWTEIEKLLTAYYEGETTLEDEEKLKQALLRDDVPQQLAHERQLFSFFDVAAAESMSNSTQEVSIAPKLKLWPKLAGVAALALLLTTLVTQSNPTVYGEINNEKIYDKDVAYQEAMKGLLLVSEKMNSGTKHLQYLNYLTEEK